MKVLSASFGEHSGLFIAVDDESWIPLLLSEGWPADLKSLISQWKTFENKLSALVKSADDSKVVSFEELRIDPPISDPEKVICIGKNYADHAREMGGEPPTIPVVFNKFASAIIAHQENVVLPPISDRVDFEAELVVVIGKAGRNISQEDALSHVFGYCCGNDISARDWQKGKPGGQWLLGKTFDTFAPLGPIVVLADEVQDPHCLDIELRLNGETMQRSNTEHLIFPIDFLISHISKFVNLAEGDLIFTGTPAGVGAGRIPPLFLKSGDNLEVEIAGLGVLRNGVVAE